MTCLLREECPAFAPGRGKKSAGSVAASEPLVALSLLFQASARPSTRNASAADDRLGNAHDDRPSRQYPKFRCAIRSRYAPEEVPYRQTIEAEEHKRSNWPELEWGDARVAALEGLERSGDAQVARWSCFERFLSARHLRDYLKRLPDFDDIEAESGALNYAENFANSPAKFWRQKGSDVERQLVEI